MKEEFFEELLKSVREGGAILRGKKNPSRTFEMDAPNARRIRKSYDLSQRQQEALWKAVQPVAGR